MVAQQNAVCPAADSRFATEVDLNAFTCGRRERPGRDWDIVVRLDSNVGKSTTNKGVERFSKSRTVLRYKQV